MPAPIVLKIDVTKLRKEWFFRSDKGPVYADLVLYHNDEPDKFGNDCSIKQNPPKDARDAGEKGHYVGNGKLMQVRQPQSPPQRPPRKPTVARQADDMTEEDIPF